MIFLRLPPLAPRNLCDAVTDDLDLPACRDERDRLAVGFRVTVVDTPRARSIRRQRIGQFIARQPQSRPAVSQILTVKCDTLVRAHQSGRPS